MVSNFVYPAWFHGGPGPYDFLKRVVMPEETTAGGYYTYLDAANHPQQVFADARARQAWLTKMANPTTRVQARLRDALERG